MFADAVSLKSPKRVRAIGSVILLAVMIAAILSGRIESVCRKRKQPSPLLESGSWLGLQLRFF